MIIQCMGYLLWKIITYLVEALAWTQSGNLDNLEQQNNSTDL